MPNLNPFALEKPMPVKTVNLDALIVRADFSSDAESAGGRPRDTISLSDLEANGFFQHSLRKPDFQRETTHWTPDAVYELVRAFLDGDLIPAVIFWERGGEYFVIDGAHRLGALMAWIRDDYGDGEVSNSLFGMMLTNEQRNVAEKTRAIIKQNIGAYAEFKGLVGHRSIIDQQKAKWVSRIGIGAIDIQWVTAATAQAAEKSFFKINQAAQPIDPTERRILQTRTSPEAIASRCIARGAQGHKYWASFPQEIASDIEKLGSEINRILYQPPHSQPVTSIDQPIAGQGYNALPFVFDLVCICNRLPILATKNLKQIPDPSADDGSGSITVDYLKGVKKRLQLISTNHPGSLGLHPLVYFYSSTGNFQPNAFLASLNFAKALDERNKKNDFTKIRMKFEEFFIRNRVYISLTMSRLGAGGRSLSRIVDLYWKVMALILSNKEDYEIFSELVSDDKFKHLRQLDAPSPTSTESPSSKGASTASKSAAFIEKAMKNSLSCSICNAAIHSNSVSFDHIKRIRDGGDNQSSNLNPTHPYCNTGYRN